MVIVPSLTSNAALADTDLVIITHANGASEKISGANLKARIIEAAASGYAPGNALYKKLDSLACHNVPRMYNGKLGKDITAYFQDGTLWKRLAGTDGYQKYEDIYAGDFFDMRRAVTCPDSTNGTVGSQWVTIAEIDGFMNKGLGSATTHATAHWINYPHLIMVPGAGEEGVQHFGLHAMNDTDTTEGGYVASKMHTNVLGPVAVDGSVSAGATINQQLKYIFGSHLKTINELLTNSMNPNGVGRFGTASGVSSGFDWYDVQSCLLGEVEVYGSVVTGSSLHDVGSAWRQLAAFRHSKMMMNNATAWFWLKDVASFNAFAFADGYGGAYCNGASNAGRFVRPRFVIGA